MSWQRNGYNGMEDNEITGFWELPDISWDTFHSTSDIPEKDKFPHFAKNEPDTIASSTYPSPTTLSAHVQEETGIGGFQGLLLALFVLIVIAFFIAQLVTYYRYCKRHHHKIRISRRFKPTTTITFHNKQGVVRTHVYDPHRAPGYNQSHRMSHCMRRASANALEHSSHSRTGSNTSEISYLRHGPSTLGSRSRSSFSSATVFMIDAKRNYRSALSLSPEVTLDLMESGSNSWSDGTMGHYSMSSVFGTAPPCHENPAFETDSSTSDISSRSRSITHSSSGASSVYRPRIPKRLHPYVTAATRSLRSRRSSNLSESSTDDYEMHRSYDAGTVRSGTYRGTFRTESANSRNYRSDSNKGSVRARSSCKSDSIRSSGAHMGSLRSDSWKTGSVRATVNKNGIGTMQVGGSVGSDSSLTSVSSMSVVSSFTLRKKQRRESCKSIRY